jgi:hypothetical protein
MNLHKLSVEITKREGLKEEISIAQVKEVLRILIDILSESVISADPKTRVLKYTFGPFHTLFKHAGDKFLKKQKKKAKKK